MHTLFNRARLAVVVALASVIACHGAFDLTSPGGSALAGTWGQDGNIPGSSFVMTLSVNNGSVTGTGTWTGEACCSGTIAVTGTTDGTHVSLDYALTTNGGNPRPTQFEQFEGVLLANSLVGDLSVSTQTAQVRYSRVH